MTQPRKLCLAACAALITPTLASAQQGAEITGVSPIEAGTAGAAIAHGQSLLDASTNPATLMDLFGPGNRHPGAANRFEIVGRSMSTDTKLFDASGTELPFDQPSAIGPWFGYAGAVGEDAAWSLAFQPTLAADFSIVRPTDLQLITVNPDGSGGPAQVNVPMATELQQLAIEPSVAWRAGRDWSFGMGMSIRTTDLKSTSATEVALSDLAGPIPETLAGIFGELSWGELITQLGEDRGVDTFQATYVGDMQSDTPSVYLKFGGTWQANRDTRIGFWYRPQSSATDLDGQVQVDLSDDLGAFVEGLEDTLSVDLLDDPTSRYDFRLASIAFPQQAGLAMTRQVSDTQRLHGKLVWTDWSRAFSDWVVNLSNPSNPEFADYLGGDGSIDIDLGIRWRDSFVLATGYEVDLHPRFTLRGGAGWSRNPVGGSSLPGVAPFNQWHAAVGATWWAGPEGFADWHFAVVAALPEKWTAGSNEVLSDLSGDRYDQKMVSALLACTISW